MHKHICARPLFLQGPVFFAGVPGFWTGHFDRAYLRCMQIMKWLSVLSIVALVTACFFPWITIENRNLVVDGFHAEAINFGKPALIHLFFSAIFIIFLLINKIWSLRTAFFISAFNVAWGVRNFIALSSCSGGQCPVKHFALYVVLLAPLAAVICLLLSTRKADGSPAGA